MKILNKIMEQCLIETEDVLERFSDMSGMGDLEVETEDGEKFKKIELKGQSYLVKPIDTTSFVVKKFPYSKYTQGKQYNINQFKGLDIYDELVKWLNAEEDIAGKSFDLVK